MNKKQWAIRYNKDPNDSDYDENSFRIIAMESEAQAKLWMQLWEDANGDTKDYSIVYSEEIPWREYKEE